MATAPTCPDCAVAMEEGFMPDLTFGGAYHSHWHAGKATEAKFFGMTGGTKVKGIRMLPITAWRCPKCGLLRPYAHPRKWRDATK